MIMDFSSMEETVLEHFCGGDGALCAHMYNDGLNKILRGKLAPGASIGLHTHDTSSEIIYILQGAGKVQYDGAFQPVAAGQCHYCPKGHAHSLINDSGADLIFFAVVPQQ